MTATTLASRDQLLPKLVDKIAINWCGANIFLLLISFWEQVWLKYPNCWLEEEEDEDEDYVDGQSERLLCSPALVLPLSHNIQDSNYFVCGANNTNEAASYQTGGLI